MKRYVFTIGNWALAADPGASFICAFIMAAKRTLSVVTRYGSTRVVCFACGSALSFSAVFASLLGTRMRPYVAASARCRRT